MNERGVSKLRCAPGSSGASSGFTGGGGRGASCSRLLPACRNACLARLRPPRLKGHRGLCSLAVPSPPETFKKK